MENKETILVTRPLLPSFEEYCNEIQNIWNAKWLTNNGPEHKKLQEKLKQYLDVQNVELLTNGHMALELAIDALRLKGEVITTPFTFVSTVNAIVRNGLKPVFCDINEEDFTIDVSKLEKLINKNTCAIMPVHVYGNVCNVEAIQAIAQKYNLRVIYDAAHAFGVKYKGRGIASFGDVSCFSFHATKVYNTIEGGAVCYSNSLKDFGNRLECLKDFGINGENVDYIGPNAKMNEFCAAMGICNLQHIENAILLRKKLVELYREKLAGIEGLRLNVVQENVQSNYAYFPVFIEEEKFGMSREQLIDKLSDNGIKARKYFYPIINEMNCYMLNYNSNDTPFAKRLSQQVITLPLYADMSIETVEKICKIIKE